MPDAQDNSKQNPKHVRAMKDGKAPLEYLITSVDDGDARVLKGGANKYGVRNWLIDNILASTYEGAIRRHLKDWAEGRDIDPDSGEHPFHHIRACCAIVLDAEKQGMLIDDRYRAESISQEKEECKAESITEAMGSTWQSVSCYGGVAESKPAPDRKFIYTVRYSDTQKNTLGFSLIPTKSFGPFATHREAVDFILHNTEGAIGVSSIDRIIII